MGDVASWLRRQRRLETYQTSNDHISFGSGSSAASHRAAASERAIKANRPDWDTSVLLPFRHKHHDTAWKQQPYEKGAPTGEQVISERFQSSLRTYSIIPHRSHKSLTDRKRKSGGVSNSHVGRGMPPSPQQQSSDSQKPRRPSIVDLVRSDPDQYEAVQRQGEEGAGERNAGEPNDADAAFAKSLFHHLDKEHSGYISAAELKQFLENGVMRAKYSDADLKGIFSRLDDAPDGKLSLDEFTQFASSHL